MIEIYLLEQLVTFYECGTLSGASQKLHLSQPALSRSMQKLETLLDVPLFERQKNRITLNETGILAAKYANRILLQEKDMVDNIRTFDRRQRTINLGSCAPIPITFLTPVLSQLYSEMTISCEIKSEEILLRGLEDGTFQVIVLTHPLETDEYYSQTWKDENLFITLPPTHPLSHRQGLYLKDLNGQSVLLYSKIGFWHDLCLKKMPDTHFLIQTEYESLNELIQASALPAFRTDLADLDDEHSHNRVVIPVIDPEANVTYYCICKRAERSRLSSFFEYIKL